MATDIVMPRLSDTMETGTIAKWLKQEGDHVNRGEVIAEIETDKANMDLESYAAGVLARISVPAGQSAGVGEPIAVIAANEEEAKSLQQAQQGAAAQAEAEAAAPPEQQGPGHDQPPPTQVMSGAPQLGGFEPDERIKASPLARRLAQENNINLMDVAGTGPGGRITKEDVQSFMRQTKPAQPAPRQPAAPSTPPQPQPAASPPSPAQPTGAGHREPQPVEMSRMQQTIARRMTEARFSAPDFVLTVEIDMTEAGQLLQSIRATEGAPRVGPNDLLIKAAALALRQHPNVNAGWENGTVVRYGHINIGNAVAISGGLVVPVIPDADRKSLGQIATESKALIEKARNNKLAPAEYEGGTFTISNLGMYGIDQFTPIINVPEACIMGVGAIVPKPAVLDGEVVVRDRMRVNLACDHRVVNGAEGAEFLQTFRRLLEHPMLVLV